MTCCPSRDELRQLLDDDASAGAPCVDHVKSCESCKNTLADMSDETDVARWRRLLQNGASAKEVGEELDLRQILEQLKSDPPDGMKTPGAEACASQIQFPGKPTPEAPLGQLDDYDILDELGSGAFGTVFRGFDRRLRREVAIKVLNPEHATIYRDRQRFEQEARVASSLQHDHIVRIYDVRIVSEFPLPYLVMELVKGESLAEHLAARLAAGQGVFDSEHAVRLVRQVALGLRAAHDMGLVHRDIKSSNVVLDGSGRAKITDFGLARQTIVPAESMNVVFRSAKGRSFRGAKGDNPSVIDSPVLSPSSARIIGTLPYMSPEQVLVPEQVDARTDLYSLGVVLYELLTGERPFRGTSSALLMQVVHDDPQSPRRLNPAIPRDLETICLKCLAKDPNRRYASAGALADELDRFLAGEPVRARPVPFWERAVKWAKRRPSLAALLATVVLVTTFGFAGVTWQWGRAVHAQSNARIAQGAAERARDAEHALREQVEKNLYFQRVARAHLEWLTNNLARADQLLDDCPEQHRDWEWRYLRRLFHPEARTLHGHALTVRRVAFSPDGNLIASTDGIWNQFDPGTVIVWDAHTGKQRQSFAARSGAFHGVAFSPNSQRLAAANAVEGITVWDATTGREELRPSTVGHYDVTFDPSGKLIAAADGFGMVRAWDAVTGDLRHELTGHSGNVFSVAFSPDGALLASTGADATGRIWNTETGQLVHLLNGTGGRCVAFSPNGRFVASCGYLGSDAGIVKVWEAGDEWKEVLAQRVHSGPVSWISFSPDSRFLALNNSLQGIVYVWEIATGSERRLLRAHPYTTGVAFSPDGRTLASAGTDRVVKLWDMTQQPQVISRLDAAYVPSVAFRPHARQLAVAGGFNAASGRGTKTVQIWDVTDPRHFRLDRTLAGHRDWLTSVAYSADGERLISADRAGAMKIWDAANGRNVLTIDGGRGAVTRVAFSPDGKSLASGGADARVRLWDAATGEPIRSLEGHEKSVNQVLFSPDGRVVASASDDRTARLWDAATGRVLRTIRGHEASVRGVAFDFTGKLLATCGSDGLINLWHVRLQESSARERDDAEPPPRTLRGHTAAVTAVSFSEDSARLASISDDATVRIWDVDTGQEALSLTPLGGGPALTVRFSSDGQLLAAARARHVTLFDSTDRSEKEAKVRAEDMQRSAIAWHEAEAADCANGKNSLGEVFHLSQLIALDPNEPSYYLRRGNAYANWAESDSPAPAPAHVEKARSDYERAVQLRGGFLFTGRGDYLTAPHVPFDQYDGFTIETWCDGNFNGVILGQGKSGDPENSIWLRCVTGSSGWESGTGREDSVVSAEQPVPRQWNHVALVYDGKTQRLFLNGKLLAQRKASKPGPLDRTRPLVIGGLDSGEAMALSTGLLKSVRISKKALYEGDFLPTPDLPFGPDSVLHYDFAKSRDRTSLTVPDLSGNGNDGTLHHPWWSPREASSASRDHR